MDKPSVVHSTFVLERSYPVSPARVFAAFADAGRKRLWFAEGRSHEVENYELDFRVGGREIVRSRFKEGTPFPGVEMMNEIVYQDIVPERRIVVASTMALGDNRISASQSTFELLPAGNGTNLVFTEQTAFFEGADGPEMRERGWQQLLERLDKELTRQSEGTSESKTTHGHAKA